MTNKYLDLAPLEGEENTHLSLNCFYVRGRGFMVSCTPVTVKDGVESFIMFSGESVVVEPAARDSKKKVAAWGQEVARQVDGKSGPCWALVERVLEKAGRTLTVPS